MWAITRSDQHSNLCPNCAGQGHAADDRNPQEQNADAADIGALTVSLSAAS